MERKAESNRDYPEIEYKLRGCCNQKCASQRRWQPKIQVGFVAVAMIKKQITKL